MNVPRQLSLREWDRHYDDLKGKGLSESDYGGRLSRHVETEGDLRLRQLRFDSSPAALRLWNFLLTENLRLRGARARGDRIVGTMKDLGTVPVMACALPGLRAFYPDGAWWTPCLMECTDGLLQRAESLGIDSTFCPVRAMLPAFQSEEHFPSPDLLICSSGAVCDDFSAVAQRLERLGRKILWWEVPRRRSPDPDEPACLLPGGGTAPVVQVECVRDELHRVGCALSRLAECELTDDRLRIGIRAANCVRRELESLRHTVYSAPGPVLPALEMLVAEMLAIHFCSDREECLAVLRALTREAAARRANHDSNEDADAVSVFWVNPVADLRAMNLLESCGGRLCGSDFMFTHALDPIPEDLDPLDALARTALADPMIGPARDRAFRIAADCRRWNAEAVVISRIPGASHCPWETAAIHDFIAERSGLPVAELEIPSVSDALASSLKTRLEALIETARARRHP